MRFMLIVKATKTSEEGCMPSEALLDAMGKYNEEMMNAGVLIDLSGLQPSSKGTRVTFSEGKRVVTDGPFAETKELIAGFWLIRVKSKEEAIDWARRVPFEPAYGAPEGQIEIRRLFEIDDFPISPAVERHRELGKELVDRE